MTYTEVFEALDISVALLALMHSGCIGVSCDSCNSTMQEDLHCLLKYKLEDIDYGPGYEGAYYSPELDDLTTWNCPISMIPQCIFELYDQYRFIQDFNQPMIREETSSLLWWFHKTYNYYINKIQKYQQDQQMKKSKVKKK